MKKIMIALLAIAVLFGFAACDNSSSTPDGEGGQTVSLINDMSMQAIAAAIDELIDGDEYGVMAMIGSEWTTENVDGTSFVATKSDEGDSSMGVNPTSVTLTIDSVMAVTAGGTTTYTLNPFTYEFSTNVMAGDLNNGTVSGTLTGYIAANSSDAFATMAVTEVTGAASTVTVTTSNQPVIILEEGSISGITVTSGDASETASAAQIERIYNIMNASSYTNVDTYAEWHDTASTGAYAVKQVVLEEFVDSLIDGTNGVMNAVSTATAGDGITKTVTVADGVATIVYGNGTANPVVIAGTASTADSPVVQLPAAASLTITIGLDASNAVAADAAFTISASGALNVLDGAASDGPVANAEGFTTMNIGTITGTIGGTPSYTITDEGDVFTVTTAGTLTITECNVTAAGVPVGPGAVEVEVDEDTSVVEYAPETITYAVVPVEA